MVEILEESGQLIIKVGGQEYGKYCFGPERSKPCLTPLRAANGLSLLADAPTDHRHHHGFWVGHGRVDDVDFWGERHNCGRINHHEFTRIDKPDDTCAFTEVCHWVSSEGRLVLTDTRTFTFYQSPVESRIFDFEIILKPPIKEMVQLHPTNEAGLPQIRVADGLTVKSGGTLTNADGKTNERGTYRVASPWMDCSGKLGRIQCGITLMDHPDNPAFPTRWFTRDYGPFAPNYGLFMDDPIDITTRKPLRLRYRVYTHSGDVTDGNVAKVWQDYQQSVKGAPVAEVEAVR